VTDRISVNRIAVTCFAAVGFLAVTLAAGRLEAQAPPPRGTARPAAAAAPTAKPAAATPAPAPAAKPAAAPAAPPPTYPAREPDLAYGAYQRGYFLTAFLEAMKRVDKNKGDARAMTLLGELYASGLGVPVDEAKAVKWYRLAAERGDRDAMYALAIFHVTRRAGLYDRSEAAKLFAAAAKLGHAAAAYDLGLLYLEGQQFPQDFARAANLFKMASQEGNAEAQYALATLYKQGRGVEKNLDEAARLFGEAALAENIDAQIEYAIVLFNGGFLRPSAPGAPPAIDAVPSVSKDKAKATALLRRAALRGSPIAQNRLAWLYSVGNGTALNPVEAVKWHLIAKAGGKGDPELDQWAAKQTPQIHAAAEKAALPWLIALTGPRT
jgi:TPR repeat protein